MRTVPAILAGLRMTNLTCDHRRRVRAQRWQNVSTESDSVDCAVVDLPAGTQLPIFQRQNHHPTSAIATPSGFLILTQCLAWNLKLNRELLVAVRLLQVARPT